MIVAASPHDHNETMGRLTAAVRGRGLTVFAVIDHAAAAHEAGMDLPDEQVLVFGNPTAGTPLMRDDARIGIRLPLRMLVWADRDGAVSVGYEDPRELAEAFDVAPHAATLEAMSGLLGALVEAATAG